jgi:hypothetical protein
MPQEKKELIILGLTLAQTICLIMLICMTSCSYVNHQLGLEDDNIAEELVEVGIKSQTGLSIDLTPESPEK